MNKTKYMWIDTFLWFSYTQHSNRIISIYMQTKNIYTYLQNSIMDYSTRFFVRNLYVICSDVKYDIAVIHILKKLESHCWKK